MSSDVEGRDEGLDEDVGRRGDQQQGLQGREFLRLWPRQLLHRCVVGRLGGPRRLRRPRQERALAIRAAREDHPFLPPEQPLRRAARRRSRRGRPALGRGGGGSGARAGRRTGQRKHRDFRVDVVGIVAEAGWGGLVGRHGWRFPGGVDPAGAAGSGRSRPRRRGARRDGGPQAAHGGGAGPNRVHGRRDHPDPVRRWELRSPCVL
mmetsp:Transcript_42477/g.123470  ORF Transcript_42477/g.123470 Transcript_42477/m.123470 type:complete len:206 (-) Transcript_42477:707-1324(-)